MDVKKVDVIREKIENHNRLSFANLANDFGSGALWLHNTSTVFLG